MKKQLLIASVAITTAFCGAFGFAACGGNDEGGNGGKKEEITLTADTDFTALVSEKVDEAGWKKAFDFGNYDKSFTSKLLIDDDYGNYIFKHTLNESYYTALNAFECSSKFSNNVYSYYYYDLIADEGTIMNAEEYNKETYDEMASLHRLYIDMTMFCANFGKVFSYFTYDEAKHSYVSATADGTTYFEDFSSEGEEDYTTYSNIEIKIVNGRLAYLTANSETDGNIIQRFYDFGQTTITYKDVEEITE